MNDKLKQRFEAILSGMVDIAPPNIHEHMKPYILEAMFEAYAEAEQDTTEKIKKLISLQERSAVRYKACFGKENPGGEQIYEYFALQLKELLPLPKSPISK